MRAFLLFPALLLFACGSDPATGDPAIEVPDGALGPVAADVDPCQALTPAILATALGVPESSVAFDQEGADRAAQMGVGSPDTDCAYDIADGADYEAAFVRVSGYPSDQAAEAAFSQQYRARTAEELAQVEEAGARAAEQLEAEGRDVPDDIGGSLSRLAASATFESVPDVGDQASIEAQPAIDVLNLPSIPGTIYVRDGAVIYALSVSPNMGFHQSAGAYDAIRQAYVSLARAVVAG